MRESWEGRCQWSKMPRSLGLPLVAPAIVLEMVAPDWPLWGREGERGGDSSVVDGLFLGVGGFGKLGTLWSKCREGWAHSRRGISPGRRTHSLWAAEELILWLHENLFFMWYLFSQRTFLCISKHYINFPLLSLVLRSCGSYWSLINPIGKIPK